MKLTIIAALGALVLASPARAEQFPETAGQFAALISYADHKCPDMRVNWPAVREIFSNLGYAGAFSDRDTEMPEAAREIGNESYAALLKVPVEKECALIWGQFGTGGSSFPDTFLRK